MQKKKFKYFFQNGRHSGHIGFWTKSKIEWHDPWTIPNPPTKFRRNPLSFSGILFTNKQTKYIIAKKRQGLVEKLLF